MEIFVFFLLVAFVLILFGAGFAFIWYGTILLKDKECFLTFCGILLITIGVFFVFVATGIVACLLTIG
jgi:hypothetical protein